MGDLDNYGVFMAPDHIITTMLTGLLNAWVYDYKAQSSQLSEQSLRLREAADETLGNYSEQLRAELARLRQVLPEPSRENPYPKMDGMKAIKELEAYMRKVERVRTSVRSAPIPPRDFVWSGSGDYALFLSNLFSIDVDLLRTLRDISSGTIDGIEVLLRRRRDLLTDYRIVP